jgi:hypothetical protein
MTKKDYNVAVSIVKEYRPGGIFWINASVAFSLEQAFIELFSNDAHFNSQHFRLACNKSA